MKIAVLVIRAWSQMDVRRVSQMAFTRAELDSTTPPNKKKKKEKKKRKKNSFLSFLFLYSLYVFIYISIYFFLMCVCVCVWWRDARLNRDQLIKTWQHRMGRNPALNWSSRCCWSRIPINLVCQRPLIRMNRQSTDGIEGIEGVA